MKRKNVILILCLALACITGVELALARIFSPELYYKITDPIVSVVSTTVSRTYHFSKNLVTTTLENTRETFVYLGNSVTEFAISLIPEPKPEDETDAMENQKYEDSTLTPILYTNSAITHFGVDPETGEELLYGGSHNLFYYNQMDEQWGNFGSDSIAGYGCGPTSMAMVVSTLTDHHLNAQEMADWFVEQGYWASGSGSYHLMANGTAAAFDLDVISIPREEITQTELVRHLLDGKFAVALMQEGHFTSGSHFIVLRGATLTGQILVADPASRERSIATWDAEIIINELSTRGAYAGGPLWFFSPSAAEPQYSLTG
ncbi:MAG: C39 family peptidase [Eubacteriales bacterium]